ncbi:hypothetical protein JTB14_009591 [Gonioctena quinquepunctata]|nr:hypothetical protein JTB14_009591 [Gonioctena quinquepunctata]
MSLFRKPKKTIQRRVFTENDDDEEELPMDFQEAVPVEKKPRKKEKSSKQQILLSFNAEEEGEVFQVKKSSHSKKVLRMFEKEKKKKEVKPEKDDVKTKDKTEIVTDDLVLVVNSSHKKPPTPPPPMILTGRDALCAGKDDLTSSSEEEGDEQIGHRFSKPNNNVKKVLESGAIPDAAMIHAARKRRQRAREMGDFIPTEEEEPEDKGRHVREDDNEGSDEERIDMDVNLALRDQERRREQFLAAQASDHEMDEWEDQQIRKGVTGAAMEAAREILFPPECPSPPQITTHIPVIDPGVPRTPQMIAAKLQEHYENVYNSREKHKNQLQKTQEDIQEVMTEMAELKVKAPNAADRFRFYQELRGYITDLVECLDEKIEKGEDRDVRDQAEEATNKGIVLRKGREEEEKQRRAAEREGRRTRRRRAREGPGQPKHVEGMSSDDEISQQDILHFDKEREQIQTELQEVVSPLVRLNLVFWDPLNDTVELEKLDWYRTLALYGLHDDETEESLAKDPDISLLPTIVEKVIIPKLTQLVDKCWDPLSSSQTLRLVGIVSRYIRRFPSLGPASKSLNNLFSAVLHKMKTSLEHDVFIPISPKLAESKSQFFQRQFASGLKLLKNITSWQGILNDNTLKELALTSLLDRYLLSALKFCPITDAVQKIRLISLILPRVWLVGSTPEFKMFSTTVLNLHQQLDKNNPLHLEPIETLMSILKTLRSQN